MSSEETQVESAEEGTSHPKMADYGLNEETYGDYLEDHLNDIVKYISPEVFLTKLRSSRVLSVEDCEEITSPFIRPTRRERARKLCDTLKTKGLEAFKLFLELLEYEYPHVFQLITARSARNPPPGYERHTEGRISQSLDDFVRMGFKVANIRNQENNLFNQLEELQKMLEFTQKEKNDLEREIQSLRPYERKNRQLQEKLMETDKEIRNLKDENREFMKKNIHYRDEIDKEQSRIEQLLIDRDDLETKLKEATNDLERMNQSQDFLREKFEEERKKSQRLITMATRRIPTRMPTDAKSDGSDLVGRQQARNVQNISTRMEILQCDLDAEREKVKDLCATLDVNQADLTNERQAADTLRREMLKIQRELDQTQLFLKHAERKNDQYFKTIQELEKEKRKAEEEKILAQQKCWDISDQKQQLFVAKHNLELKFDRLRQNYERVRQSHRNSLTDSQEAVDGGVDRQVGVPNLNIRHRVTPLPSPRSPGIPSQGNEPIYTTIPYNCDPFRQFRPYPSDTDLDESTTDNVAALTQPYQPGGNLLPRSVQSTDDKQTDEQKLLSRSACLKETHGASEEECPASKGSRANTNSLTVDVRSWKTGRLRRHPIDDNDPRCWSEDDEIDSDTEIYDNAIQFRYDREASSSGSSDAQRDSDVYSLKSELVPENSPYISWFDGQDSLALECSGDQKDGDDGSSVEKMNMKNLYVRCNISWEDKTKDDTVPIRDGEFLFISDTAKPGYFQVKKVEPTSGHHMGKSASGLVPDYEQGKHHLRRPSAGVLSPDPSVRGTTFVRRDAIRSRDCSPYTVIAPLKAVQKLPVLLNGNPTVVEAIFNVLVADAEEWAMVVRKPVLINQRQNWREMCDLLRHTIMPGFGINYQTDRDQHRYIIINIKLTSDDCQEQLKTIFGHDFEDVQCDRGVGLSKWSLHSETLVLPSPKISDRTSLMCQLKEKIMKVQENIFWMTISWKTIQSMRVTC